MNFALHKGYIPGAIGRIVELHGTYYHRHSGFGSYFESKVAKGLAGFCERFREDRDGLWLAIVSNTIEGSIAIDGSHAATAGAHLRWFITSDAIRGTGAGNALLSTAIEFCRARQYGRIYLDTFEGLNAARHLYEKCGFRLTHQVPGSQWGSKVNEQQFVLEL